MKSLFATIAILFAASMGYCVPQVSKSSFTATQEFEKTLCGQRIVNGSTTSVHGVLYSIIVSSAGGAGSAVSVCNSSYTSVNAGNACANVDTRAFVGQLNYNVIFSSGLMYTSTGTATKAIIYDCF